MRLVVLRVVIGRTLNST